MRIYPAVHYTMGGLWVDYNLMSTIPGLHVIGEANFSDHGANRLGASALMQGLADGYFIVPLTIGDYLGSTKLEPVIDATTRRSRRREAAVARAHRASCSSIKGTRTVTSFHRELGKIMWEYCGMARNASRSHEGARDHSASCATSSGATCAFPGTGAELNQSLEHAGRVADFLELARADVPRRAASRGIVRRTFPRRASDAGWRSAAR